MRGEPELDGIGDALDGLVRARVEGVGVRHLRLGAESHLDGVRYPRAVVGNGAAIAFDDGGRRVRGEVER